MKKINQLPLFLQDEKVRSYYFVLKRKILYRFFKRAFDVLASLILFFLLLIPSIIIGLSIVLTSKGGMFFLQERVGRYGKKFKIIKFRTMKANSEGNQLVTVNSDYRITKVGSILRKTHLDEFPQLINVFIGQMSFVGTRPEVPKFVYLYQPEWNATLLMRPGITSTASFSFDDEAKEINNDDDYVNIVLPKKMELNLKDISLSNLWHEIYILFKTVF